MAKNGKPRLAERWARFRFSVVGPLFAAPPKMGELRLSRQTWAHPVTGEPKLFSFSTIERWFYQAKKAEEDPVAKLRRKTRKDSGRNKILTDPLKGAIIAQHRAHKSWSYQLHYDNIEALVQGEKSLGRMPSYWTVLRFMKTGGLFKRRRPRCGRSAGRGTTP